MTATRKLHELGQSLWVDNITRTMLDDGHLARYIDELSVTGLTSNPTIFDKAIGSGDAYDGQVAELAGRGLEGEESVRMHDFEVGWVESVDISGARLRATLSMDPKVLEQLTVDHTLASLGITGPAGHRLVRALGVHEEVDVDLRVDKAVGGDVYVLCSDGLSKMLPEDQVLDVLREKQDLEAAVAELIGRANAAGGKDNVSVILVRVDDVDVGVSGEGGPP